MMRATALLLALFSTVVSFAQTRETTRVNDDSDWWSIIRENSTDETLQPQAQDVPAANFQILGVVVGSDNLEVIQAKLGKASLVTRGDASTARAQICYTGLDRKDHLTFEIGEVQYEFYLFSDGAKWSGSDLCTKSKLVAPGLKTLSGLHLGQTVEEVKAILGKPTSSLKNGDIVYFRQISKKTSASDLKKMREYYSTLTEKQFHENYDFYDMSVYIVARFSRTGLVYLGVSKSDTY